MDPFWRITIVDPLKVYVILQKHIRVDLKSNHLILIVYLRLDKDETFGKEYFIEKSILTIQNYDFGHPNMCVIERFFTIFLYLF